MEINPPLDAGEREWVNQMLKKAPATRCGACGAQMEATAVTIHVGVDFDWSLWTTEGKSQEFLSAYSGFADGLRYSGELTYVCPQCGVVLLHRQRVTPLPGGIGFCVQSPSEEASQ